MNFVLGVEGGNTKTLALIAREDGVIVGSGRAGCSDIYGASLPAAAIIEIEQAVEAALREAGIDASDTTRRCLQPGRRRLAWGFSTARRCNARPRLWSDTADRQ